MFWYIVSCELDKEQDTLAEIITKYKSSWFSEKYYKKEDAIEEMSKLKSNNGNRDIVYWIEEDKNEQNLEL